MTNEKLTELLKIAYRWGRDNGSNKSDKNFNDLLQTEAINQALRIHDVVGQSEQLACDCPDEKLWEIKGKIVCECGKYHEKKAN